MSLHDTESSRQGFVSVWNLTSQQLCAEQGQGSTDSTLSLLPARLWIKPDSRGQQAAAALGIRTTTLLPLLSSWLCLASLACMPIKYLSRVRLFLTLWTVARQAPLSMGILQISILEGVAVPSSRGSFQPRDWTHVSYISCVGRRVLYQQRHLGRPPWTGHSFENGEGTLPHLELQFPPKTRDQGISYQWLCPSFSPLGLCWSPWDVWTPLLSPASCYLWIQVTKLQGGQDGSAPTGQPSHQR